MNDKLIPIVFSTDHNFVEPTCVTIHSLLTTKRPEIEYTINVIINNDVTNKDRDLLTKQVKLDSPGSLINFIEIGEAFKDGFEIRDISTACYNRLMIPWLLLQYDKIIYSDVDIIFKNDISEVYDINLEGKLLAGCGGEVWNKGMVGKYLKKIDTTPEEYVNSGFLVINSKLQRESGLKSKYLELSQRKFLYQDQDILNIVCKGKIVHIPKIYNLKPVDAYSIPPENVKVIHYVGLKPWDYFTYRWCDWWAVYQDSIIFDPKRNKDVSSRILSLNSEIKKRKKVLYQKMKFIKEYLRYN